LSLDGPESLSLVSDDDVDDDDDDNASAILRLRLTGVPCGCAGARQVSDVFAFPLHLINNKQAHSLLAVLAAGDGSDGGAADASPISVPRCPHLFSFLHAYVMSNMTTLPPVTERDIALLKRYHSLQYDVGIDGVLEHFASRIRTELDYFALARDVSKRRTYRVCHHRSLPGEDEDEDEVDDKDEAEADSDAEPGPARILIDAALSQSSVSFSHSNRDGSIRWITDEPEVDKHRDWHDDADLRKRCRYNGIDELLRFDARAQQWKHVRWLPARQLICDCARARGRARGGLWRISGCRRGPGRKVGLFS
jgi:hypothetical protein